MEGIRSFSGAAMRRARIDQGLSHDALSVLTGRSRPNLIAWEKGQHRPIPRLLIVLSEALEVDPLELLDVTEETATLADLRARAGRASSDVAANLGIHVTTYRRLERGKAPLSADITDALAALFRTTSERISDAYHRARAAQ